MGTEHMVKNEYKHNARFRSWVDGYCAEHGVNTEEALKQDEVRRMFRYYTDL